MAPRQGSPFSLSSPPLVPLDSSPLDLAERSPESTVGRAPLSLDLQKRILFGDSHPQVTNSASTCTTGGTSKARSTDKENPQNLPVVVPTSVNMPVPLVFTTNLSNGASTFSQEAKETECDGSSSLDAAAEENQILQAFLDLTSNNQYYQDQDQDLSVKDQLMQRVSKIRQQQAMPKIRQQQEMRRMKQFQQQIHQEKQIMCARQQSRIEKVRALEDVLSALQQRCELSLQRNELQRAETVSSSLPNAPLAMEPTKEEALLAEVARLQSQVLQLEQENNAKEGTIDSLRDQNQTMGKELQVAQNQKAEMEHAFHTKIATLAKDRHELIYRLIEMEQRVAEAEEAKETSELSSIPPTGHEDRATDASVDEALTDFKDNDDDEACGDDVNGSEGELNTNNKDSKSEEHEVPMLKERLQELEHAKEVFEETQEALVASLMEANEKRREAENALAVATEVLEMVRADYTILSDELETLKVEASHLSGARTLLLDELEKTTTRLNDVLHHRNQLESENTSLRQSRDINAMELADNMALFLSQLMSIEGVIHRLQEVRILLTQEENTDADSEDDYSDDEESSSHDKETSNCHEEAQPEWVDSALAQIDEMEISLTACLEGLSTKIQPIEANESKEASPKEANSKTKFSIKGLLGRVADVAVSSSSSDGKSPFSQSRDSEPMNHRWGNVVDSFVKSKVQSMLDR